MPAAVSRRRVLINVAGSLYGTTSQNGVTAGGTLFSMDAETGKETLLYSFCDEANCADGRQPEGGLTNVRGKLYGVTMMGGTGSMGACENYSGCGVVFSIDPKTSAETVLHSFNDDGRDGWLPDNGLLNENGRLYGTTTSGGTHDYGAVFSLDLKTGSENVLHSFNGKDGANPFGALIDVNGSLYGTASQGGNDTCTYGCGTVFSIDLASGKEKTVYSFCSVANCTDGYLPLGALTNINGTLYGTTGAGGTNNSGTVYSIDPSTGAETVLHSFSNSGGDGTSPNGSLVDVKGVLYGTTWVGGTGDCEAAPGCGTVFSVDLATGGEKVVHSFQNNRKDGYFPAVGLVDVHGLLYGTTVTGGVHLPQGGTVFRIIP